MCHAPPATRRPPRAARHAPLTSPVVCCAQMQPTLDKPGEAGSHGRRHATWAVPESDGDRRASAGEGDGPEAADPKAEASREGRSHVDRSEVGYAEAAELEARRVLVRAEGRRAEAMAHAQRHVVCSTALALLSMPASEVMAGGSGTTDGTGADAKAPEAVGGSISEGSSANLIRARLRALSDECVARLGAIRSESISMAA